MDLVRKYGVFNIPEEAFQDLLDSYGLTEEEYNEMKEIEDNLGDNWMDFDVSEYGYDGVISYGETEYIAFNPNQIKSATENIGSFSTQSNDIRYQTLGLNSIKNIDSYNGNNELESSYNKALELESEYGITEKDWMTNGAKRDLKLELKLFTGWDKNANNEWVYEVDDIKYIDRKSLNKIINLYKSDKEENFNITDYFKISDDLLKSQKDIKNINIKLYTDNENPDQEGNFKNNTISLNRAKFKNFINERQGEEDNGNNLLSNRVLQIINHEIAHFFQDKDGYFSGANLLMIDLSSLIEDYNKNNDKDIIVDMLNTFKNLTKSQRIDFLEKTNERYHTLLFIANKINDIDEYIKVLFDDTLDIYDKYRMFVGEINARNVGSIDGFSRLNMSKNKRLITLLEDTEDISRSKAIRIKLDSSRFLYDYYSKNLYKLQQELQQQNSEPIFVNMEPLTEKEKFIEYAMQHPTALADIYIQNGFVEQVCKI
jgi:hypothetical protein